jgi:superfamily II DNA/RNA helicase
VASTLENIANRLNEEVKAGIRRDNRGVLISNDLSPEDLTDEEWEELSDSDYTKSETTFGPDAGEKLESKVISEMKAEVEELQAYASLARSITVNEKATKLNDALEKGFSRLRELGAPEKAIIFTDSTKTQEYIARSLANVGRSEGLILFNGSNDSPGASEIYKAWLAANKDGDVITGISAVDRRKALVDYFRTTGKIMIATEAAAEGINLQFCSMVVNYDLPWNPQRVEQRIGRAHRFGQKYDVISIEIEHVNIEALKQLESEGKKVSIWLTFPRKIFTEEYFSRKY